MAHRFEQFRIDSTDGIRHYRIRVALPETPLPEQGFPAIYLLDGNAALMETDAALLAKLAHAKQPMALVYVGYDNDLRIDADARAFDYTPRRPGGDEAQVDAIGNRRNGGADAFLDLLETDIFPKAESLAKLDPRRRTLWGHSYGGLFVLHARFTRPRLFAGYVAVDPSLWWADGQLLKEEAAFEQASPEPSPTLTIMVGEGGGRDAAPSSNPPTPPARDAQAVAAMRKARAGAPADAAAKMVERLDRHGTAVRYRTLPGQSHGETLGGSLRLLLGELAEGRAP